MHRYTMQFYIRNLSILGFQYLPGIQAPIPSRIPRDNYSTAHNPTLLQLWKLRGAALRADPATQHSGMSQTQQKPVPWEELGIGGSLPVALLCLAGGRARTSKMLNFTTLPVQSLPGSASAGIAAS